MCARCRKNHEIHARTWAAGYFHDSMFFAYFDSPKSYVLLSDGAGDVTEYHVLRRQRNQVFLAHVLRSERTRTAVRSSGAYVLRSQGESAEIAIGGKVDEKMEKVGFVWIRGIPGLRRVLRP